MPGLPSIGDALAGCINLTELNLSDNVLQRIEGLGTLARLRKLTLTSNRIARVEGLEGLQSLEHLLLQARGERGLVGGLSCSAGLLELGKKKIKSGAPGQGAAPPPAASV